MSRIPRGAIRIGIALQAAAMVVLYAAVNFIGFENYTRWDFSRTGDILLSTQTRRVIREFKKPLSITVISSPTMFGPASQILGDVRNLLNEVQFSGRERVVIEYVDPTRNLSRMRELQAKHKFTNADNVLILESDGRSRLLNMAEMADFDMSPAARGEMPQLLAFRGEQVLTGAMIGLLKPDSQTVYFLQGHGEPAIGAGSPVSTLVDYLQKQNARIGALSFASSDTIPADAAAIILRADRPNLSMCMDVWHLYRMGLSVGDLDDVESERAELVSDGHRGVDLLDGVGEFEVGV